MDRESLVLVRYGAIPEVARFSNPQQVAVVRGDDVIVATPRGIERGTVLERLQPSHEPRNGSAPAPPSGELLRCASEEDRDRHRQLRGRAEEEFDGWRRRIAEWRLDLELVDLEWTLDQSRLILYVLNDRGPECTKLALQAAAGGWGVVQVQPVAADGLQAVEPVKGCGTCGCHN